MQLNLSAAKCKVIRINVTGLVFPNLLITSIVIERVTVARDLGIYVEDKLNFNSHGTHIAKKSYRKINFIYSNFKSR